MAADGDSRIESLGISSVGIPTIVTIRFSTKEEEKKALGFLLGRFSGTAIKGGFHIVPEAALVGLAGLNISFEVLGRTTYAQQIAAFRGGGFEDA